MTAPVATAATTRRTTSPAFPPPPRIVRRHIGGGCAIAALRLITIPYALIGLSLLSYAGTRVYVLYRGTPVTAVVDRGAWRGFGGATRVWFHYGLNGERHRGSVRVHTDRGDPVEMTQVGGTFRGRAAAPLGFGVFVRDGDSISRDALPVVLFALVFNGIVLIVLNRVWVEPIRHRWIVKHGQVTTGKVTARRRLRGRNGRGVVSYQFTTADGHAHSSRCEVTPAAYEHLRDGTPVTVLYDPRRPRHSVPYELCGFVVERR